MMFKSLGTNFRFLLLSSGFSNLADGVAGFAFTWLFSLITRDAQLIALALALGSLPHLIFILFAGVISDKFNRKKILITSRLLQALLIGFVTVTIYYFKNQIPNVVSVGSEPEFQGKFFLIIFFYIISFVFGILEVTRDNTSQSFLPQIVKKESLSDANGKLFGVEITFNSFLGAPLAGFLIGVSLYTPFVGVAALLILSVFYVSKITGNFEPEDSSLDRKTSEMIKEGFSWMSKQVLIKRLAIFTGIANFIGSMGFPVMILFAQEILLLNSVQFGFLTYGAAAGGVLGSLVAKQIHEKIGEGNGISFAVFLFCVGGAIFYFTSSAWIFAFGFFLISFGSVMWNVLAVSIRQEIIPDKLLGRVNSVYRLLALGSAPIGALLGGSIVKYSEYFLTREFALRLPFLIESICMMVLFVLSISLLTQKLIDNTRQEK